MVILYHRAIIFFRLGVQLGYCYFLEHIPLLHPSKPIHRSPSRFLCLWRVSLQFVSPGTFPYLLWSEAWLGFSWMLFQVWETTHPGVRDLKACLLWSMHMFSSCMKSTLGLNLRDFTCQKPSVKLCLLLLPWAAVCQEIWDMSQRELACQLWPARHHPDIKTMPAQPYQAPLELASWDLR